MSPRRVKKMFLNYIAKHGKMLMEKEGVPMNGKVKNVLNWVLAIVLCSLGICLCTKADFGLSMIAAPPYIIHCFMREHFAWYTQGMSEYIWEAVLLLLTCLIIRRFRKRYLLSFVTAVLSGFVIDFWLWVFGGNGVYENLAVRIIAFVLGSALISLAVAFVFRTTLPPQVYELAVNEVAEKYGFDKSKTKLGNDIIMLAITLLLALTLTRDWTGIGIGTVVVTFINAPLIRLFGTLIDKIEKNTAPAEETEVSVC